LRPSSPRVITGEEALKTHIVDSSADASSSAHLTAIGLPVILGQRTISTGAPSIAEVMHGPISATDKSGHTASTSKAAITNGDVGAKSEPNEESATVSDTSNEAPGERSDPPPPKAA